MKNDRKFPKNLRGKENKMSDINILYIHGFGSKYKPNSGKVRELSKIGNVFGVDIDYTDSVDKIDKAISDVIIENYIELVVGTSMGGYYANRAGSSFSIPFVMINPATNPKETLVKYIGDGVTYFGENYNLGKEVVDSYKPIIDSGNGILLIDMGDDVIDPENTLSVLSKFETTVYEGGSHRFEHIAESLDLISSHYYRTFVSNGCGEN